jgi:xanthosine utilization system XapX-like protein
MKLAFTPLSIVLGLMAGLIGKKIFEQAWGLIDDEEPPDAKHREISVPKLIAALVFEGAIFRLVKGLTDHGARRAFARTTGTWPGEEAPEPE